MSLARKIPCTVNSIADHGQHVYTVDLIPARSVPAFRPGQFLHLTVDDYDPAGFWPESRVFSIASSPRERDRIRICYSVIGRYTKKMEQELKVGGKVWIKLPYGDFVIDDTRDATLIAGGTGISAFTAFLDALTPDYPRGITLVYGARAPELVLFQDRILRQAALVPRFAVVFFIETPDEVFAQQMAALPRPPQCFTGRIALDAILRSPTAVLCLRSSAFHLSGPPVMLKSLAADLCARGVAQENIRTDAWE